MKDTHAMLISVPVTPARSEESGMRWVRRRIYRRGERRGATIVLVAMLITVLIGVAGIAIDFARMYEYRNELQTVADAAATAGAIEILHPNRAGTVQSIAVTYGDSNRVEGQQARVATGDVQCGKWNFSAPPPNGLPVSACGDALVDPAVNAVQAVAHDTAAYTLAQIFGKQRQWLQASAIAAVGYVDATTCLRPWAVSYQTMLDSLFPAAPPSALTYSLNAQDVRSLQQNGTSITLSFDTTAAKATADGVIRPVVVGGQSYNYSQAVAGNCGSSSRYIGHDSLLIADAAVKSVDTEGAMQLLCPQSCRVAVKLALWDFPQPLGLPGIPLQYHVRYVGWFVIEQFCQGCGAGGVDQVTGYFTSMASDGTFTSAATPLTRVVLVR